MPNFEQKPYIMKHLILILLVTAMSCKGKQTSATDPVPAQPLSGSYEVTALEGATLGENKPVMIFEAKESRINGNTGCNSYFGQFTQDDRNLSFGMIGSTEMACQEPYMQTEMTLYKAFQKTALFDLENSMLVLKDAEGNNLLTAIYKRD